MAKNPLPSSIRAGALACSDATPGIVSALLRRYLLANHFDGIFFHLFSVPTSSVVGSWMTAGDCLPFSGVRYVRSLQRCTFSASSHFALL